MIATRLVAFVVLAFSVSYPLAVSGQIPDNAHAKQYGGGWVCDDGYQKQGRHCAAIPLPPDAYLTGKPYGKGWACNYGYRETKDDRCEAVVVPENAFLIPAGDDWRCMRGFHKRDGACDKFVVPAHGYLRGDTDGTAWECKHGYMKKGKACFAIAVPEHGILDQRMHQGWRCSRGYRPRNDQCILIEVPENAYLTHTGHAYGRDWRCNRGFRAAGQSCVAVSIPKNAHLSYSGSGWECNPPHKQFGDACRLK